MKRRLRISKKKKIKALDIDITSLLDILVIMLVFLLKNYNASDLKIDLVKGISLPGSYSQELGNNSVVVMINNKKNIYVNNKNIGSVTGNDDVIPILLEKLTDVKNEYDDKNRIPAAIGDEVSNIKDSEKSKIMTTVNIVLDKKLPYEILRKVMHTSATAGFPDFKLIVKGDYD